FVAIQLNREANPDAMKLVIQPGTKIQINPSTTTLTDLQTALNALTDYNYTTKQIFDIDRRSFNTWNDVASTFWRPNSPDDTWEGPYSNSTNDWLTLYNNPATKHRAVWTYDLNPIIVNRGSADGRNFAFSFARAGKSNLNIESPNLSGDKRKFFQSRSRLVKDSGENAGVFVLYQYGFDSYGDPAPETEVFTNEILLKYHSFEIGQGPNHFRAKIATGDTINEAEINRNSLSFWNYRSYDNTDDIYSYALLSNMNFDHGNYQGGGQGSRNSILWIDTTTFVDVDNQCMWSFDHESDLKSALLTKYVNGVSSFSVYQLLSVYATSTYLVFGFSGFGPFNGRIGYLKRSTSSPKNLGVLYIAPENDNTYRNITNHNATNGVYNLKDSRTI
ncbi:MAG: hypothetical protein ACRCVW_06770, partial [Brevinema sp.]